MSLLQEGVHYFGARNEQMQVQCGIELPKGTENLLGCSHKRGLKAKITEGVDWPRA